MEYSSVFPGEFAGTERFTIERRLGAGGMGVVYQAWDHERGARIALKTLRALDAQHLWRLKREFRALADLSHPNLVRLGELICENGHWFYTMELIEGRNLLSYTRPGAPSLDEELELSPTADTHVSAEVTEQLRRACADGERPRYDEARLRAALAQLALGATALHQAGKVHRDIKPSNVLVTTDGRAVLLDFGVVGDLDSRRRSDSELNVVGTALYMAPEQAACKPVGPEADWYAVGAVLYEALTGQPPFCGAPLEVLMRKQVQEPPPASALQPLVPRDLDALCSELLRFDPATRPDGAQVLVRLGVRESDSAPHRLPSLSAAACFVGRAHELAQLDAALAVSRSGAPVTLFVYGESGIGKTALVRQFIERLDGEQQSPVVLSGRCYERESVPFKAFDGVVDALSRYLARIDQAAAAELLPRDAPLLARVFPVLRQVPALARAAEPLLSMSNPLEVRARAFGALRELLGRLATHHAVVLFVDDFQWSDADSRALLGELLQPPHAPAVLLLLTVRTDPFGGASAALPAGVDLALGDLRGVRLPPLSQDESDELCITLLRDATGSLDHAASIASDAEGHPLFLQELVRHVAAGHAPTLERARLDDALWARVLELEAPARRLLEVIAVAGAPIPVEVATHAARLDAGDAARLMPLLRVAHLSRPARVRGREAVEPYHNRVREAVLANLPDELQRAHHGELAAALEASGAATRNPQVLVRHLEAAGQPERAATQAAEAARRAMEILAFDQAAELYRVSLRLGRYSEDELRRLRMQLGDALACAGRGEEAADALLRAAEGADAATRFACQRRAAEQLLGSGHLERGRAILERVLAEIGERMPATPGRALASLLMRRAWLKLRGYGWTPRDASEVSARTLAEVDVCQTVAIALGMIDSVRGAAFQARGLSLALKAGERRRVARAIAFEAAYLATQGSSGLARCERLVDEVGRIAAEEQDPYLLALAAGTQGLKQLYQGNFQEAAPLLLEAETRLRDQTAGTALELSNLRIFRLIGTRYLGAYPELKRDFHTYVRDARRRGDKFSETTLTRAFNCVWLVDDQPEEARRALDQRTWSPPEGGYHVQHWYELLARAELALYCGQGATLRAEQAQAVEALERLFLVRMQMIRAAADWMHGRLALAEADAGTTDALDETSSRIVALRKQKMSYSDVWADLLDAAVHARRGDKQNAALMLRRAMVGSSAKGQRFYETAAQRRLGELLGGHQGTRLIEASEDHMRKDGVRAPRHMTDVVAPRTKLTV